MDAKITLSFDAKVIENAKKYAASQGISLSRLMEIFLSKITSENYKNLEDFPIDDWVKSLAEGEVSYVKKQISQKKMKDEYFNSKKRK
jgi:antitoxin component of RelBE/YafQ-DinJ toxin-antitoxin module